MNSAIMLATSLGIEPHLTEARAAEIRAAREQEEYQAFLARKAQLANGSGFAPVWMPDFLIDFQKYLVEWNCVTGRYADLADCGMGKTVIQLVTAENVVRKTNKRTLILTPLAVSAQTLKEADKFGVEAAISRDGKLTKMITITNYERLHHFNPSDFNNVICDEVSILKNFAGATRAAVTEFMRQIPFRGGYSATAAPNDYTEIGNLSQALGNLGYTDMLTRFFKNEQNNVGTGRVYGQQTKWRFKGHSREPFFRWLSGFIRAGRRPSDFGAFDDSRFVLPSLTEETHVVKSKKLAPGLLFEMTPKNMQEEREESRRTLAERCEKAAELAQTGSQATVWCNLNPEGDLLTKLLPDFVQVKAKISEVDMREREEIFDGFSRGQIRGLIIKPKVGALGMNWQNCAHAIEFPTYSYEQYYQLIRRFWRYGQKSDVKVDSVTTESGCHIAEARKRKSVQADQMFTSLVRHMHEAITIEGVKAEKQGSVPVWMS